MNVWQTALERSFFQAVAILVVILCARFADNRVVLPWFTALTIVVALTLGNLVYAGIRA